MTFNTISILGLGYIGLPTAAVLANSGRLVIGVDINPRIVETINQGQVHIIEPELELAVQQAVEKGQFFATTEVQPADAFIIAVPTPLTNNQPDISHIHSAVLAIAPVLRKGNLIILESTSPVETTEKMAKWLTEARPDLSFPIQNQIESDIYIAYCPERILPGKAMTELLEND